MNKNFHEQNSEKPVDYDAKYASFKDTDKSLVRVNDFENLGEFLKTIDILREENKLLSSRLRDLIDNLEEIPNRKPPHY